MTALIFDTETSGLTFHPEAPLDRQPHIIEWGGCLVNERGEILDELDVMINPGFPIPAEITKITGITDQDVATALPFELIASQLWSFFERADLLIAHNLPFDHDMMAFELRRAGLLDSWPWPARNLCTVQEHAEEWGRRMKMTELYEYYTGEKLAQTHRALDDVHALLKICILSGVLG